MPKKKRKTWMPTFMSYLGIDPGKNGGIALIWHDGEIELWPMPSTELDTWYVFNVLPCTSQTIAVIEWIHPAIQGIGKSQMSKLYGNYTSLRMALIAVRVPFEDVKPLEWQRGLGISSRKKTESTIQWKDRLRAKAQQLFPKLEIWKQTKTEQRQVCDALLIAEYLRRKDQGKL